MQFKESIKLLSKYKINIVQSKVCTSYKEVLEFSKNCYPIVIKVYSTEVVHKNKAGLIQTGILNENDVLEAYKKLTRIARNSNLKRFEIVVQKEIRGNEFIIGAKYDETFGHIVIFGLGGIYTEILRAISMRVCPINRKVAKDMIKEIANLELNDKSVENLASIIMSVSKMIEKSMVKVIDLNPVIVNENGVFIVDVRLLL